MGRLIKNHWARLIIITAAVYQIAAAIEGFFWPKILWDFLTHNLDPVVKPVPVLQSINLVLGLLLVGLEWPLPWIAGCGLQRSLEFRLLVIPACILTTIMQYQATNAAIYYFIGMAIYFWAYSDGEVVAAKPWTLPKRSKSTRA